jgi:hypothetical protein
LISAQLIVLEMNRCCFGTYPFAAALIKENRGYLFSGISAGALG